MRSVTIAGALLLLTTTVALGQQPTYRPGDSAAMAQMTGMFTQMGPMYESMTQAMVEGTLKAFEKPETIERLARLSRRYYDALIKQGFTKEEALQIVAASGIVSVRAGR
jgi:Spy/CpxP family protein refolding chaperone